MKRHRALPVLVALSLVAVLLGSFAAGCGSSATGSKPQITNLDPSAGQSGSPMNLVGAGFGDTQGTGVVHIGSKIADVVSWTNVLIVAKIPAGLPASVQGVTVLTPAGESNEMNYTVISATQPDRKPGEVESNTPVQAMAAFEKKKGVSTAGWTYSVVKVSTANPNWKIDQGGKPGGTQTYFLLKKVNGNWVVVDDGNALTAKELQGDGAPSDLWINVPPPQPQPQKSQSQVILDYLTKQGITTTGVSIAFVKQSKTDPNWQLFLAEWPDGAQIPDAKFVLHLENGAWVVKNYGTDISNTPGMPPDLAQ